MADRPQTPTDRLLSKVPSRPVLMILGLALVLPGLGLAQVTFTDVALEAGFQDRLHHGRALVAADFNGDGWVDFYVGNPGDPVLANDDNFILWNDGPDGEGNHTFTKGQVLLKGKLAFTASAADFDNDGDQDLFIGVGGQEGIGLDHLFRNDDGFFTDITMTARVAGPFTEGSPVPGATSSGNWADYDNDGDLDLFSAVRLVRDTLPLPGGVGVRNSLFRNEGGGDFTDVTVEAGLASPSYGSMTSAWGDFDNDGWVDLYIPNHEPVLPQVYRNNQDGTFTDIGLDAGALNFGERASWAGSVADFNHDGLLDILSFARGNPPDTDSHALLMNRGGFRFVNAAKAVGLVPGYPVPAVMGTGLGDYDNDGYLDIVMANGGPLFGEADRLYHHLGVTEQGTFAYEETTSLIDYAAPVDPDCVPPAGPAPGSSATWVDHDNMLEGEPGEAGVIDTSTLPEAGENPCLPTYPYRGHGSVFVDYDKDGDLDLAMVKGGTAVLAPDVSSTEPNRLFRNDGGNDNNWLFLELEGTLSNRDGFGARVELTADGGATGRRTLFQPWQGQTGFSTNQSDEMHFGLADNDTIESLRVIWPSGRVTLIEGGGVNRRLEIVEEFSYAEDFNDGVADGWTALAGNWQVNEGVYGQLGDGRSLALHEDSTRTDFTVIGRLTYVSGERKMALLGRASADGLDFYAAILGNGRAQIFRSVGGQLQALGSPLEIEPMTPGRSYLVRMEFDGGWIRLSVDQGPQAVVVDDALASGAIGVATNNTNATLENVAVY